jgi:hypothetical protein
VIIGSPGSAAAKVFVKELRFSFKVVLPYTVDEIGKRTASVAAM